jgi:hypothetical protein
MLKRLEGVECFSSYGFETGWLAMNTGKADARLSLPHRTLLDTVSVLHNNVADITACFSERSRRVRIALTITSRHINTDWMIAHGCQSDIAMIIFNYARSIQDMGGISPPVRPAE